MKKIGILFALVFLVAVSMYFMAPPTFNKVKIAEDFYRDIAEGSQFENDWIWFTYNARKAKYRISAFESPISIGNLFAKLKLIEEKEEVEKIIVEYEEGSFLILICFETLI